MPRDPAPTREKILTAAYGLFYREGFARVSMDAIAAAAGVTKRTLYYHHDSKDALAAAVLEHQHAQALARIREWGASPAGSPEAFLAGVFRSMGEWAARPGWLGSGFTRLTMELADRPGHPARQAARRHKRAVEDWLAGRLEALGARNPAELARQAALLMEGSASLMLVHRDPAYAEAAAETARRLARNHDGGV